MKKLIIVLMLILSVGCALAQQSADMGVQLGATAYWGTFKNVDYAKSINPEVGILGRWNFNKRIALRGQIVVGRLSANGLDPYSSPMNDPITFNRSFQTVEAMLEFNFRNYKLGSVKKENFTPFLALGSGWLYSVKDAGSKGPVTYTVNTLSIPIAAGFKFNITKRLGGMAEVNIRKTFTSNIDNLIPTGSSPSNFQSNNTDYYATLDVSLTWQLWDEKKNCALYDKLRKR